LIVKEVFRNIVQMRTEGISVLLVERNVRMSPEISDHTHVLENGQIVYSEPVANLKPVVRRGPRLGGGMEDGGLAPGLTSISYSSKQAPKMLSYLNRRI
jgi:hypothetical protein